MNQPQILIIDDEPDLREAIADTLSYEPYDLLFAENGEEGLACLRQHSPVVVLLDLRMPVMDGLEVLQQLKVQQNDPYLVIVLTGHGDDEDVEQCYELGIHAFLRKPFNIFELQGLIKHSINLKQAQNAEKERSAELVLARVAAEEANDTKSQFLRRMSHELRTPLNAIIGFSDLQKNYVDERIPTQFSESSKVIREAGKHLLMLIDDIMDVAEIAQNKLLVTLNTVELDAVIENSLALIAYRAKEAGVTIAAHSPSGIMVSANGPRLRQVLVHLLTNAINFNHQGGFVTLSVKTLEKNLVEVSVEDTGVGIDANQHQAVFASFTRLNYAEKCEIDGTGTGLALSKGLVEKMNGSIGFHPAQPQGTVFWIHLQQV